MVVLRAVGVDTRSVGHDVRRVAAGAKVNGEVVVAATDALALIELQDVATVAPHAFYVSVVGEAVGDGPDADRRAVLSGFG